MSNFKSGSGNLDFGASEENEEGETPADSSQNPTERDEDDESKAAERSESSLTDRDSTETEHPSDQPASDRAGDSTASDSSPEKYPYFVRRRNVGDERDTRLEIHVRDGVADQETEFRNELAERLGVNEISKTDAREFALLAAFHHPERVAELMRDEGFGALR